MTARRLLCFAFTLAVALSAQAQELPIANPEKLTPPLNRPLKLLATTAMSGKGQDYFTLQPRQKMVIGTVVGPAIIQRVWSTSSASAMVSLDVTVDGKTRTLYEKGKGVGLAAGDPLQAMDKQAYWSYVPLAVKQKAVFTARSVDPTNTIKFYLQVGYRQVSPDQLKLAGKDAAGGLRAAVAKLMGGAPSVASTPLISSGGSTLQAPFTPSLSEPTLRFLQVTLPEGATIEQVEATRLTVTCDGSKTIDVPLGALFGQYWQLADYHSAVMSVQGKKTFTFHVPMPIAQSVSVAISRYGKGQPLEAVTVTLAGSKLAAAPKYHLCAQYFSLVSVKDQPLQLLNVTGPGLFIGSNLAADGVDRKTFAFLEGNEQLYVDGVSTPTIEGTGTEDYFNNSWYFETGQLTRAFHGVPFIQPKDPPRVVAYRWMLPDCVPFKTSLRFDMQHGSRNGAPNVLYRGVMFWYQQGQVNVAEPAEAKLPTTDASNADAEPAAGGVSLAVLGAVLLVVAVVVVGLVVLYSRRKRS